VNDTIETFLEVLLRLTPHMPPNFGDFLPVLRNFAGKGKSALAITAFHPGRYARAGEPPLHQGNYTELLTETWMDSRGRSRECVPL